VLVDTHVHVVSADEAQFPLQPRNFTDEWYREAPCTIERLIELMDNAEVAAAVLVQAVSAYSYDNWYCAHSARRFPERCTSVGAVDVTARDAVDQANGIVHDQRMRGIRWFAVRGEGVREPRALWEAIASLDVPTVVTVLPDRLAELADTIRALPAIPLALDHCGFADFSQGLPDALLALAPFPNVYLKVSSITLDLMAAYGDAAEAVGELAAHFDGRLMWGSDFSQTHDRPYDELAEWGRKGAAKLPDEQHADYLGGNAVRMWPELGR